MIKFPRLIWFEDAIHFPHFALLPVIYLLYSVCYIYITRMATAGSFAFRISSSSNPFFFTSPVLMIHPLWSSVTASLRLSINVKKKSE